MFLFINILLFLAFFIVSIPLHEICHILAMKFVGIRPNKPRVVLFQIPTWKEPYFGCIDSEDGMFIFPEKNIQLLYSFVLISGGLGSAILMSLFFFPVFFTSLRVALIGIVYFQITCGIIEVIGNGKF